MSTHAGDPDSTAHPTRAPGVVTLDLRSRHPSAPDGAGPDSPGRRIRGTLTTAHIRCLVLVLDETSTGADDDVLAVAGSSVPVVVALEGSVRGHVAAVALAADLRVAAAHASVQVEPLVGGTSTTLPRLVGDAAARRLLLAPRSLTATEALQLGLVHEVHDGQALVAAQELATTVAARAGQGSAVRRALAPEGPGTEVARALEHEARLRAVVDLHPQD